MSDETQGAGGQGGTGAGESQQNVSGTLIRGADGKMYFIPDEAMARYQVTDEDSHRKLTDLHAGNTDLIQTPVDARRVSGPITQVVVVMIAHDNG